MTRLTAILVVIASFLLVAPVIESGTRPRPPSSRRSATPRTARATRTPTGESDWHSQPNITNSQPTSQEETYP